MRKIIMSLFVILASFQCGVAIGRCDLLTQTSEQEEQLKRLESRLDQALKLLERTQTQVESLAAEVT